jgi:hypothetical protein
MKQKYEVYESVVNVYEVEAESFEEALSLAEEMNAPTSNTSDGFVFVCNKHTYEALDLG